MAAPWLDVGWATSDRLKRDLAVEALRRALVARNPAAGLVHHSDRTEGKSVMFVQHRKIGIGLKALLEDRENRLTAPSARVWCDLQPSSASARAISASEPQAWQASARQTCTVCGVGGLLRKWW